MAVEKVPGIYGKISAIRTEMPTLEKNGVGPSSQGSYKFLSIDDILKAVVPLENKYKVISYLVSSEMTFHYNLADEAGKGRESMPKKENVQGIGDFVFRFVDTEDGSFIDVNVPSEGGDSQDKATRKTVTQAQKIAKITTYDLITGEPDPDAQDGATHEADKPVPAALAKAQTAAKKPAPARPGKSAKRLEVEALVKSDDSKLTGDLANKFKGEAEGMGMEGDEVYTYILKKASDL